MDKKLKRAALHGMGWSFLSSISGRAFQMAATLILAKLLMPEDFGLFAFASILISGLDVFSSIGFAQALIYQQGDIRRSANTAFILSTAAGIFMSIALYIAAPYLGRLFNAESVVSPMRVMAMTLIPTGAAAVPAALLDRDLKFKAKTIAEVPGAFMYAVISVVMAYHGYGVWSLVGGWCTMIVIDTGITWIVCSWRPQIRFSSHDAVVITRYGMHLVAGFFASFIFLQLDRAAIGKWVDMTHLGYYSVAFTVCNLPSTTIAAVINRVMFPTYSRMQDIGQIRDMYIRIIRHLAITVLPVIAGIMVTAGPLIQVIYGNKWTGAVPFFHILAFYGLARAVSATTDSVFMSTDNPMFVRQLNLIQLVTGAVFVYPAVTMFGAEGVAVLFTIAALSGAIYGIGKVMKLTGLHTSDLVSAVYIPVISAIAAGSASIIGAGTVSWLAIGRIVIIFIAIYTGMLLMLDKPALQDLAKLASKAE